MNVPNDRSQSATSSFISPLFLLAPSDEISAPEAVGPDLERMRASSASRRRAHRHRADPAIALQRADTVSGLKHRAEPRPAHEPGVPVGGPAEALQGHR